MDLRWADSLRVNFCTDAAGTPYQRKRSPDSYFRFGVIRAIDIVKYPDDAEVSDLAHELSTLLTQAGWTPTVSTAGPGGLPFGIVVRVDPKNPPKITAGNALISLLSEAGLIVGKLDDSLKTPPTGASVRLNVGKKYSLAKDSVD